MRIVLDIVGGDKKDNWQNKFMRSADLFERGKHFARYFQVEANGEADLSTLCEKINQKLAGAGGYTLFVGIRTVDSVRVDPMAFIESGVQSISLYQKGRLGWTLFRDMLDQLGYKVEVNENMVVRSVKI